MVKRFTSLLLVLTLLLSLGIGTWANGIVTPEDNPNIPAERQKMLVVDEVGVLDDETLRLLNEMAESVCAERQCEVAAVIVSTLGGRSAQAAADDYFDYNGYGYGENDDGILLLIAYHEREYAISTYGYAIDAFTDYGQRRLADAFVPYLAEDDWAGAIENYLDTCYAYLTSASVGKPIDVPQLEPKSMTKAAPLAALIAVVLGFVLGAIPTGIMKRQLRSVAKNYGAANYSRRGLQLRRSDDQFLYSTVNKVPIPKEQSSGGSTTHFSSSGRSHGGSSGHF